MLSVPELIAGHELDALVAEKVMGWHRSDTLWRDSEETACKYVNEDDSEDADPGWEFRPSTELDSAWQVVEHFNKRGRDAYFELDYGPHMYGATFVQGLLPDIGETAPLAICRAALAAVEH